MAAIGFAFLQVSNRKANQLIDAYRTAFGLLLAVELMLLVRTLVFGDASLLVTAPWSAVALFTVATFFHFVGGWTLLALSQQQIGVARTGALVSAAPIIGTLVAAVGLDEPLTLAVAAGVLLAVVGVFSISLSGSVVGWGRLAAPLAGSHGGVDLGDEPAAHPFGSREIRSPGGGSDHRPGSQCRRLCPDPHRRASLAGRCAPAAPCVWIAIGGVCGAIAVSAQWISFDLTTIAIAITVQQLSVIFVIALVPLMFRQPFERMNPRFFVGAALVMTGAVLVVLS